MRAFVLRLEGLPLPSNDSGRCQRPGRFAGQVFARCFVEKQCYAGGMVPQGVLQRTDSATCQAVKGTPRGDSLGGEPWCAQLLSHSGVIAFKAAIPQDIATESKPGKAQKRRANVRMLQPLQWALWWRLQLVRQLRWEPPIGFGLEAFTALVLLGM